MDNPRHRFWPFEKNISMRPFSDARAASICFALGLIVSLALWHQAIRSIEIDARHRFEDLCSRLISKYEQTMISYEQILRGGCALLITKPNTTRSEFRTYVEELESARHYPGLQGVGYSVFVSPSEKAEHERRIQSEGFKDYKIRPEGQRDLYSAIVFLEPFDWRNRRAFGYDMYSNEVRRIAMDAARDSGQAVASARVTLVQETTKDVQAGFLLYLPLYAAGTLRPTIEERQHAIVGYIYSPFRASKFFMGILGTEPESARKLIDFRVYDGSERSEQTLIFSTSKSGAQEAGNDYKTGISRTLYGREWSFDFRSTKIFDESIDFSDSHSMLFMSLFITTLLSLIIAVVSTRQKQLKETNEHMSLLTRELSHRGKNTLSVVQAMASFSFSNDKSSSEGREVFIKRLHALGRVQSLLYQSSWRNVSLIDLVHQEFEPIGRRVRIDSPEIKLNSNAAQTFALVLHELATNAVKYGSLSTRSGGVSIGWEIIQSGDVQQLKFVWKEYGGPPVAEPGRHGFGRTVLSQQIGHGGQKPSISYEVDGLRYEMTTRIAAITDVRDDRKWATPEKIPSSAEGSWRAKKMRWLVIAISGVGNLHRR